MFVSYTETILVEGFLASFVCHKVWQIFCLHIYYNIIIYYKTFKKLKNHAVLLSFRTSRTLWRIVYDGACVTPAYFKFDGPMMEIKMWRTWQQCISPKCLMSHLYLNGPSTERSRSVATVTYAYRVVGILRNDKQRRNRSHRKQNCKSFSLGKSRLELRTKSQSL